MSPDKNEGAGDAVSDDAEVADESVLVEPPAAEDREIEPDSKTVTVTVVHDPIADVEAAEAGEKERGEEQDDEPGRDVDPVVGASALSTTSIEVVPTAPSAAEEETPKPRAETEVFSRRNMLSGEASGHPEPAAMLTTERLLQDRARRHSVPEGFWPHLVYRLTFGLVDLGDSARVRLEKETTARITRQLEGGARFVPVLTRKGGVGKTTVTMLLGMALAATREDRIIAIDANPDRGTLAERVPKQTRMTVRDVVQRAGTVRGFTDLSTFVSRDPTRLDVLASDTDPTLSEAFNAHDYEIVAEQASRFYSLVLTDCGTGIVHSVMGATLKHADEAVIVSGGSVDEARLASETLTWLETNGYGDLVRNAVVAINTATQGTNLVKVDEIEGHFRSRVRAVVRIPYDPLLAAGSVIDYARLHPRTRAAARELAAIVIDGLVD